MTYRQTLTKKEAVKQVAATQLQDLTSRELIDDYEQIIKKWLANAVAEIPSPQMVMVRVALSDSVTISKFCAWLVDYYRKKKPKQPFKYLWIREIRSSDADDYVGQHYHLALITSASQTNMPTAPFAIAQEKALITSWWASRDLQGTKWLSFERQHDKPVKVHHLRTQRGLGEALQHLSYLAKAQTKHITTKQRSIGCSS